MGFKRRSLLKASAVTLAGWALGGPSWSQQSQRSGELLAAPAEQKFALLVGINHYSGDAAHYPQLRGCVNDLELQRQLLIHRFDFKPKNILTLSNRQATRVKVQGSIIDHLLGQMGPNDTALFHFSGYGSSVSTSEGSNSQRTLVLHDSSDSDGRLSDWPEESLLSLLTALPSDRVLAILDTSYALPALSVNSTALRARSRLSPSPAPFDSLHQKLEVQREEALSAQGNSKENNAVILRASQLREVAVEFESQAGPVGLLTYCLTQQLWQSSANKTLGNTLEGTTARLQQSLGLDQQPQLAKAKLQNRQLTKLGLKERSPYGSAGAVTAVKRDGSLQLWLGGYSAEALSYCEAGAVVRLDNEGMSGNKRLLPSYFRIQDRDGMLAEAVPLRAQDLVPPIVQTISTQRSQQEIHPPSSATTSTSTKTAGNESAVVAATTVPTSSPNSTAQPSGLAAPKQPIQEQIRIIPRELSIQIGLDDCFDRVERVDATSAITSIPNVSVASSKSPTDYVFGRVTDPIDTLVTSPANGLDNSGGIADLPAGTPGLATSPDAPKAAPAFPETKYGLLLLNQQALPATIGATAEAVKTAIQRLQPYLETLRAEKALQLLENTASSDLPLEVRWETLRSVKGGKPEEIALRIAQGHSDDAQPIPVAQLTAGDQVRYNFKNQSDRPLYVMVLGVNSLGQWLMPFNPTPETHNDAKSAPSLSRTKATITSGNNFNEPINPGHSIKGEWPVESQKGLTSLYIVAIAAPFDQSYALLSAQKQDLVEAQRLQRLRTPFELSQALLEDLQLASNGIAPVLSPQDEHYALNTKAWATFRYSYSVG